MGCDIHLHAEVKKRTKWTYLEPTIECIWCREDGTCLFCNGSKIASSWYESRNYDFFAMLADVRNGSGFAGCKTGTGFIPISQPRGLPNDCCDKIRKESERWGIDGHSHSYLTVRELSEYPIYDLRTKHTGLIRREIYDKWKEEKAIYEGIEPDSWCGDIGRANVIIVDEDELPQHPEATYVRATWDVTYSSCATYFFEDVLPALQEIADRYGQDNVRIIFWFDN